MWFRGYFDFETQQVLQTEVERHFPGVMLYWKPDNGCQEADRWGRHLRILTGGDSATRYQWLSQKLRGRLEKQISNEPHNEAQLSKLLDMLRLL